VGSQSTEIIKLISEVKILRLDIAERVSICTHHLLRKKSMEEDKQGYNRLDFKSILNDLLIVWLD
jgi:hypothetical protein